MGALPACSGKTEDTDCSRDASCGGNSGTAGATAEAGAGADSEGGTGGSETGDTCADGKRDAGETDVDCGGPSCAPCMTGDRCEEGADCRSELCAKQRCVDPDCSDDVKDQDETDVDCGGASCGGCLDGMSCLQAEDCQSLVCSKGQCESATCDDEVQNQDESDVDCGGICQASTAACPEGAHCNDASDCASLLCSDAGECLADPVSPADVIDDFEDGDLQLSAKDARVGTWYAYGDGSGVVTIENRRLDRESNGRGLRNVGKDFINWGSGVGVDLFNAGAGQSSKQPYDASTYSGITFIARAESSLTLTVSLPDADTDEAGGICTTCDHHYGKQVTLTKTWQRFTVSFAELQLEPGGVPEPTAFDPSSLVSIRFLVGPGQSYDLYVDDLAFVKGD